MPWLETVGIPYVALLVLTIIEGKGGIPSWEKRFIELGIDACILGIGVSGAIFSNQAVQKKLGSEGPGWAVFLLLCTIGLTGLCLHQRDWTGATEKNRARISIFIGLVILAVNTAMVLRS